MLQWFNRYFSANLGNIRDFHKAKSNPDSYAMVMRGSSFHDEHAQILIALSGMDAFGGPQT